MRKALVMAAVLIALACSTALAKGPIVRATSDVVQSIGNFLAFLFG